MKAKAIVHVVNGDEATRGSLSALFEGVGLPVASYASAETFLSAVHAAIPGCLVTDVRLPSMDGLQLQAELACQGIGLPVIFLTAHGTIPLAVKAIRAGAVDFLSKPVDSQHLLDCVQTTLRANIENWESETSHRALRKRLERLTQREREVLDLVLTGQSSREAATRLGLSRRTVEHHRSRILLKTGVENLVQLARLADACW